MKNIPLFILFTIVLISPCKAIQIAQPVESLGYNSDGTDRFDPRDSDHVNDETIFFSESDVFTCSFFRVETRSYNVKMFTGDTESTDADSLIINFLCDEDILYDVTVNILMYGEIDSWGDENTGIFVTNITKTFGTVKRDEKLEIQSSDYGGDKGLIPSGVQKFKVMISYRIISGGSRHYDTYFMWEDQSKTDISQRWNMGYAGNIRDITFEQYFGDSRGYNSYVSAAASVEKEKSYAHLNRNTIIGILAGGFIAFICFKVGFLLITKFDSFAVELTGGILLLVAFTYVYSIVGLVVGFVEDVLDVIKAPYDAAKGLYNSVKSNTWDKVF